MMNSYLSIFDPYCKLTLNLNFISMTIPLIFINMKVYMTTNKMMMYLKNLFLSIFNSFKTNLFTSPINTLMVTYFIYIFILNFFGMFSYIFTMTSHISFTLFIALPLWTSVFFYYWNNKTKLFFAHLVPSGTPMYLTIFMVIIETISNFIRPLTLAIRLCANMIAGHLLMSLMSSIISIQSNMTVFFIPILMILLMILELFVAFIQAYVFTLLVSLYFSEI